MPSLGVSSLDFDRVVRTTRSFFRRGIQRIRAPFRPARRRLYMAQDLFFGPEFPCKNRFIFLASFGGKRQIDKIVIGHRHQVGRELCQIVGECIEAGGFLERPLVHVKPAIDLDLQCMEMADGAAIVLGDEASGVGLVMGDGVAHADQQADRRLGQRCRGGHAETVADDEVGPDTAVADPDARRHRVAIDQHGKAEPRMGPGQKPFQRLVIRLVDGLDTRDRFRQRQAAGIDVEPFSHQLGHSAKPAGHARRADVAEGRHGFGEHARIEFPGFPVDVKIGAREVCRQHRRAERDGATEQFVDIAIFGAADGVSVQPCHGQEPVRIVTAAMRRVEEEGDALFGARPDFERGNDRKILGCRFQFERTRKHQCIMVGRCHLAARMSSVSASGPLC